MMALVDIPCPPFDPNTWVKAFVTLTTVKGFYYGLGLIVLAILCFRPPPILNPANWRCRKCGGTRGA